MAEKKTTWTEQQKRVIGAAPGDILVSASAGTGKTEVLSARCVNRLSQGREATSVLNVLVLTFTEAAAEQMRSRIARQLAEQVRETNDARIAHHLLMIPAADISTIHSFCRRLISEYFYELAIDPSFSVIDEDEATLLKADVLEKTVEWAWRQSDLQGPFAELLYRRNITSGKGFLSQVITISDFLDSIVSRENWYERAIALTQAADPSATNLGDAQKRLIAGRLQSMLAQSECCLRLCRQQGIEGELITRWRQGFIEPIGHYLGLLQSGEWDAFVVAIRSYEPPSRLEYKRSGLSDASCEIVKDVAKNTKSRLAEILDLAILNPHYLDVIGVCAGRQTQALVRLVRQFGRLYEQAKRSLNCVDFADLEHQALRLLTAPNSPPDDLQPSKTAAALRQRYKHIFVDEYQDINPVQQAILRMLGSKGNVFVVGDVKQSIYAFRGAEPAIFVENLHHESFDPGEAARALRVDLNANFRSEEAILDFVNRVFSRIMTAAIAGVDYDDAAKLRPGEARPSDARDPGQHVIEFCVLDESPVDRDTESEPNDNDGEHGRSQSTTARQRQAAFIARRIRQLVGAETGKGEQIYDRRRQAYRGIKYGDIVVLMRSLAKKANDYVEILRLAGIPVTCDSTAGYFETTEITDVLCLLKILDNPQRDIEFAAVLRSPFFNITDSELARIRLHGRSAQQPQSSHGCAVLYSESGGKPALHNKLRQVLASLDEWRTMARQGGIAELLWHVYRTSGLLSFVSALPNGQARRANLLKLHDRAIQFSGFAGSAGGATLSRFVEFVEKLLEAGEDWSPAQVTAEDAVRILSVHKSKGLEFPVVFLAELQGRFNTRDVYSDIIVDAEHTLGLRVIDRRSNSKTDSLAHEVIAEKKLGTMLAEEMRILYVAMTRAEGRLIMTASAGREWCKDVVARASLVAGGSLPAWQLRNCRSHLEWILSALADQKALHEVFATSLTGNCEDEDLFDFRPSGSEDLEELSQYVQELRAGKQRHVRPRGTTSVPFTGRSKVVIEIEQALSWRYPFSDAAIVPAKTSVSELTHRNDEYVRFDYSAALDRQPAALSASPHDLLGNRRARLVGTAVHLVISKLDLSRPVTIQSIEDKKRDLLIAGAISGELSHQIDADAIRAFFDSEPGRAAVDPANTTWREWPFTFSLPAADFDYSRDDLRDTRYEIRDTIVVQGVIDMLVRSARGLVVIDFKTDNIGTRQVDERGRLYDRQLELYGRAASAILKLPTTAKWLYFVGPRCAVSVDSC